MTFIKSLGREDLFGDFVSQSTHRADLPSDYPHSAERWSYYIESGGSLVPEFIEYGDTTGYTDNGDYKTITPSVGTVHVYSSAERFRHVVGHQSELNFVFNLNQSLQTGEKVVVGYGDPDLHNDMASADGWFLEFEPGLADDEAYFSMYRNGTIVSNGGSRKLITLNQPVTDWKRYSINVAVDGPGSCELRETYNEGGEIKTEDIGVIVTDGDRGPTSFNKRCEFAIQAGGVDNGLEMNLGSVSFSTLNVVLEITRLKEFGWEGVTLGTTNTWVPLMAIRVDPNRFKINTTLDSIQVLNYTGNDQINLIVKSFNSEEITFTGGSSWDSPDGIISNESVLEVRSDVDTFFDSTGTAQSTSDTPGGYQIGRGLLSPTNNKFEKGFVSNKTPNVKRDLFDGDIAVVFAKSASTGDVNFEMVFLEEW